MVQIGTWLYCKTQFPISMTNFCWEDQGVNPSICMCIQNATCRIGTQERLITAVTLSKVCWNMPPQIESMFPKWPWGSFFCHCVSLKMSKIRLRSWGVLMWVSDCCWWCCCWKKLVTCSPQLSVAFLFRPALTALQWLSWPQQCLHILWPRRRSKTPRTTVGRSLIDAVSDWWCYL